MTGTFKIKSAGGGYVYIDPASVAADIHLTSPNIAGTLALLAQIPMVCEGRLTLASGTPVTTTDQTAKTTVYFTPHKGNRRTLYTNSAWEVASFSELSVAVPATTNTPFDIFLYNNSGTDTLETVNWTNTITRATALTTQDGVYVKSGSTNKRYLGTLCTTGTSGQCEDSMVNRFVWNYYNRIYRPMLALESTATWDYTTAAFRQANANTANQLNFVIGISEDLVLAEVFHAASNTSVGVLVVSGIGLDSTTTVASTCLTTGQTIAIATGITSLASRYENFPGIGQHSLVWLEYSAATGTTTWRGAVASPTGRQSGISGFIWG